MSNRTKATGRNEDGQPALVPELRFPEFRGAGGWTASQLIDLSAMGLSNGVFNDPKKVGTGYKLINVGDMYIDTTIIEDRLSLLTLSASEFEANQVKHGDIFFTRSSLVKSGIAVSNIYLGNSSDVTFDGHLIRFRANTSKVAPLFAHYLFKTTPVREQLVARGKSGTMTTIGQSDVGGVMLSYPEMNEQRRVADCLSSLDELIAAQARKVDALKTHKKGLMQQLFPHEGETQPRLRFPEFCGEWIETKLISLSRESLSNGVFNDPKKVGAGYKLINVSDMYIGTTIDEERLLKLELSTSEFEANQVIHGDIFFTRSSLVKSGIAVSNIYLGKAIDVTFDGHLIRFRPDGDKVVSLFTHYLFKTEPIRAQLIARGKSATMTTIGQADVASVTLSCPEKNEQQRIANCLTSLDTLITAQTQELETLKTHKKGLMQQLFPSAEAVEV